MAVLQDGAIGGHVFAGAGVGLWLLLTRRALAALGVGACLLLAAAVSLYALDPFTKVAYAVQAGIIAEIVMGLAVRDAWRGPLTMPDRLASLSLGRCRGR